MVSAVTNTFTAAQAAQKSGIEIAAYLAGFTAAQAAQK